MIQLSGLQMKLNIVSWWSVYIISISDLFILLETVRSLSFYPLMYLTLFILGMVGYEDLRVSREPIYICRVVRGGILNADVLARFGL